MNRAECEAYKRQGIIADGMIPKLDNSFKAIEDGVLEVVILHAKICFQKREQYSWDKIIECNKLQP